MKKSLLFCGLYMCLVTGCSQKSPSKFDGKWQPIAGSKVKNSSAMWIEKIGNKYSRMVFFKWEPKDTILLNYDGKADVLLGYFKMANCKIQYLKDKNHLLVSPVDSNSKSFSVELEKVDK